MFRSRPVLIGCSVTEAAPCALETRHSIGGSKRGAPAFSTAGGAELRKRRQRRRCQDSSSSRSTSSLRSLENGTASPAARHEGLHPNCALTLQDATLQLRSLLDTDRRKPVRDVCRNLTEELGPTGR